MKTAGSDLLLRTPDILPFETADSSSIEITMCKIAIIMAPGRVMSPNRDTLKMLSRVGEEEQSNSHQKSKAEKGNDMLAEVRLMRG